MTRRDTIKAEIRQGTAELWVRLETGDCYRLTNLENTVAFWVGSWEKTTVQKAGREHGKAYAAYVWAFQRIKGNPDAKIYHAWRVIINGLGYPGKNTPPTKAVRDSYVFQNGQSILDCPVIAETEL